MRLAAGLVAALALGAGGAAARQSPPSYARAGWSVFVANADGTGLRRITPCR